MPSKPHYMHFSIKNILENTIKKVVPALKTSFLNLEYL